MKIISSKGITLIALVITIIILLILSGVSISMVINQDGIIQKAIDAKEKANKSTLKEKQKLSDVKDQINGTNVSSDGYDYTSYVNSPSLKEGMIPITYDTDKWVVADKDNQNKSWYDYGNKKWANICTVDSTHANYRTAEVGTEIPVEDMTTMFVWIPRYAYSIVNGYQTSNTEAPSVTNANSPKIDVVFLVGNTNRDVNNITYDIDYNMETDVENGKTPMIVHPGFRIGNKELTGIWVAKFEASGTDKDGNAVGNGNADSSLNAQAYAPDSSTYVKLLPSVISWRHITVGESQYRCMQMGSNTMAYGWDSVNTHLIKNMEWGAVAYLCYSKFGVVPMVNGCGYYISKEDFYYNIYTGMGPKSESSESIYNPMSSNLAEHKYDTNNGQLASTTGNIYGVYDMSGGSWERVAVYLDNGNNNLNTYGKSSSNSNVKYFQNGVLNSSYFSLWDRYEVSEEEKNNAIIVDGETNPITQSILFGKKGESYTDSAINEKYNTARKRLTDATYNLLAKAKGIGINEFANSHSYYGIYYKGNYTYLINESDTNSNYGRTWNNDYIIIGHGVFTFVVRGGAVYSGTPSGILRTGIATGVNGSSSSFRPVISP